MVVICERFLIDWKNKESEIWIRGLETKVMMMYNEDEEGGLQMERIIN